VLEQQLPGLPDGVRLSVVDRSDGVVQMVWQDRSGVEGPELWLETIELSLELSRGRHVTLDEAEEMVTTLARTDSVAVDDLGDLEYVQWADRATPKV
jgi:hypothetical protein